jgi:serine/threonine-protein kinase
MNEDLARLTAALADRYRIEREIGAGGMATVYLAHDLRHERDVAIKVVHRELAAALGAERFLAEIKTTARLQNPHILALLDSGTADGILYYVMPFVAGESLRARLTRERQLPVDDAIRIAREVADALGHAHTHGIVHRDIKPENILLHEGHALVADFGIALAVQSAGGQRMTQTGLSLGTPQYMSPEQAMGEKMVDARADIYALGAVTYEMLTGEPPFTGATVQAIVAKVIATEPVRPGAVRKSIPVHVEAAIMSALAKLPADRCASATQFADALSRPGATLAESQAMTGAMATRDSVAPTRRWSAGAIAPWAIAALCLAALAWQYRNPRAVEEVVRLNIVVPDSISVRTDHSTNTLALSPDGRQLVYVGSMPGGRRGLYVRNLQQLEPRLIPGTINAEGPFFSPDGLWVGYVENASRVKKVALDGGPPVPIATVAGVRGGAWGADDRIVLGTGAGGLLRVSAGGGSIDTLTKLRIDSGESSHRRPQILPGGKAIIFTIFGGGAPRIATLNLATGVVTKIVDEGMDARYTAAGQLIYGTDGGALIAVPFDAKRLRVTGSPVSLLDGMMVKRQFYVAEFALSSSGRMAYLTGAQAPGILVFVDRAGVERATDLQGSAVLGPRYSPDAKRVALSSVEGRNSDIRVLNIIDGALTRLTFDGLNQYPEWTHDGKRIAFQSTRDSSKGIDLYWTPADNSGAAQFLYSAPGNQQEVQFGPDDRTLIIRDQSGATGRDLIVSSVDSPKVVRPYLVTPFDERSMVLSPNGKWLAYVSDVSSRNEVYVRAFPQASGQSQVSVSGGIEPRWSRNGRVLYYRSGDSLMSAAVTTEPTFATVSRTLVFARSYYLGDTHHAHWDVAPDDNHFVFVKTGTEKPTIVVTLDFFSELKRRMQIGKQNAR